MNKIGDRGDLADMGWMLYSVRSHENILVRVIPGPRVERRSCGTQQYAQGQDSQKCFMSICSITASLLFPFSWGLTIPDIVQGDQVGNLSQV